MSNPAPSQLLTSSSVRHPPGSERLALLRAIVASRRRPADRAAVGSSATATAIEAARNALVQWNSRRTVEQFLGQRILRQRARNGGSSNSSNNSAATPSPRPRKRHKTHASSSSATPASSLSTHTRATVVPTTVPAPAPVLVASREPALLRSLRSPIPSERGWASAHFLANVLLLQSFSSSSSTSVVAEAGADPALSRVTTIEPSSGDGDREYYSVLLKDYLLERLLLPAAGMTGRGGSKQIRLHGTPTTPLSPTSASFPLEASALLVHVPSHCFHRHDLDRLATALSAHAARASPSSGLHSGSAPSSNSWTATTAALLQVLAHLVLVVSHSGSGGGGDSSNDQALAQHRLDTWLWAWPNLEPPAVQDGGAPDGGGAAATVGVGTHRQWSPLASLLAVAHAGVWPRPPLGGSSAGTMPSTASSSSASRSSSTALLQSNHPHHLQPPRWDPHALHPPLVTGPHGVLGRLLHPRVAATSVPATPTATTTATAQPGTVRRNPRTTSASFHASASASRTRSALVAECIANEHDDDDEEAEELDHDDSDGDDDEEVDDVDDDEDDDIEDMVHDMEDDMDHDNDTDDDDEPEGEEDRLPNLEESRKIEAHGAPKKSQGAASDLPQASADPKEAPPPSSPTPRNPPSVGEGAFAQISQDDSTGFHPGVGESAEGVEARQQPTINNDEDLGNEEEDEEMMDEDEDDDDDDDDEEHDDDDDDDEDGAVEIELADLEEAAVAEVRHMAAVAVAAAASDAADEAAAAASSSESSSSASRVPPGVVLDRKRMLLQASMQVLCAVYPHVHHQHHKSRRGWIDLSGEMQLIEGMNLLIQPPKKPPASKIILRRAPTQEEFFRGSLSRNPLTIASLTKGDVEPTVADLRLHIASELGMADSAELLEIIVAGKILDVSLKLRVVHQVLWRNHLLDNPSQQNHHPFLASSTASGLSMIISSTITERFSARPGAITADTPLSALPAMVATYRLAGVDGEATEDTISTLADPEESQEHEFWDWTRDVVAGRGIFVLLRSIQHSLADTIRKIRRDAVGCTGAPQRNWANERFCASPPLPPLVLLQHCCQVQCNRKRLLQARAPTVLLTCLLDTLKVLGNDTNQAKSNPTAEVLQQLIERLTSDISEAAPAPSSVVGTTLVAADDDNAYESDAAEDAASMPLLLEALETIELSPPLRLLIAKLLPFLTYGQADLSSTLAEHFSRNIKIELLGQYEKSPDQYIVMNTFVQTAISLPANSVCNSLRFALIPLVDRLEKFVAKDQPKQPPPSCAAFWNKAKKPPKRLESQWRCYLDRDGMMTAFRILIGLCRQFAPTQSRLGKGDWLRGVHWIEATSESVGLLAEELLDALSADNAVATTVDSLRKKTRQLKRDLAEERRAQALQKISGQAGRRTAASTLTNASSSTTVVAAAAGGVRSAAASFLGPVLGLFSSSDSSPATTAAAASLPASKAAVTKSENASQAKDTPSDSQPSWLAEMEAMEDEEGLICSVCQEGRTLQPEELLGLYAYVKKVTLQEPVTRSGIEGVSLLKALPHSLPSGLMGDPVAEEWFLMGRSAAENVPTDASTLSRKSAVFVTTVSAGNAIHFSCHRKARQADRTHPKAPKSEWEGAILRNSRVNCNVILPLVSCRSSRVPLIAVDCAMTEHQAAVSNLIGSTPKSMLWTVLHDLRLLLLRMAYGEPLNADCGGGSLASNCQLVYHQLLAADMFDKDAQVDQPQQSSHARGLPAGFLAACAMGDVSPALTRGIADAAPMAALNCVAFGGNSTEATSHGAPDGSVAAAVAGGGSGSGGGDAASAPSRMQWKVGQPYFLRGLVMCAGRRHALGLDGSGCQRRGAATGAAAAPVSSSSSTRTRRNFAEVYATANAPARSPNARASSSVASGTASSSQASIEDFAAALRPFLTYCAAMDHLSSTFAVGMEDGPVEVAATELAELIESCRSASTVSDLLGLCRVPNPVNPTELMDWLQKGMMSA